jgi:hypothetical protein
MNSQQGTLSSQQGSQARYLNIVLGVWLFISAFVWHHSQAQFTNTWIMGIIVTAVALISLSVPAFRYVNTLAGAWLIISGFALPRATSGTTWNNVIIGILVFLASLVPNMVERQSHNLRRVTT